MVAIHEILKKRIIEAIRTAEVQGGWKVVVVDEPSYRILESACKIFDILEEKVTLVEQLEKTRQTYPLEAVYIITPSHESVSKVIEDFTKSTPLYVGAHVFLTSPPEHSIYQRLMNSMPPNLLKAYKELFIEFHAREAHVYSFESPNSFFRLYSPVENAVFDSELKKLAKQLLSVCVSLGENPLIRYQKGIDTDPDYANKSLPYKLAQLVQNELDNYTRKTKQLSPGSIPLETHRKRCVLFIMDRTVDMYTPLLHEFTYQAMANDLLSIENGQKYTYSYTDDDGATAEKEAILDETDTIWVGIRHKHMRDCIDQLMKDFNKFLVENAGFNDKDKAANLNDIKKMLATLPQFQNMKEKYSVHLNIAQECMSVFDKEKLAEVATVEQNCATGYTSDSLHPKTLMEDMIPILDNPVVSTSTKVRMLMLYIMYKRGITEEDRVKLLNHARISMEENESINNLEFFGEKLIRTKSGTSMAKKKKYRQPQGDDIHYEFSRYIPRLKNVLESHINKTLSTTSYPYTKDPAGGSDSAKSSKSDLRSSRPTWFLKDHESRNPRIIVFITGGVTYSELRTAYEITEKHRQDVIIGSTHILTPQKFVDNLALLRKPPTTQPYTPPNPRPLPVPPKAPPTQDYSYNKSSSPGYQGGYYQPQGGPYSQGGYSQHAYQQQGAYQGGNYQPQGNYPYAQSNPGYQQGYSTKPQYMNQKP